jgi:hypothetical protein
MEGARARACVCSLEARAQSRFTLAPSLSEEVGYQINLESHSGAYERQ